MLPFAELVCNIHQDFRFRFAGGRGLLQPLLRFLSVERPFKSVMPCPSFLPESNTAAPVQRHGENDAIHGFAGFTGIGC